MENFGFLDVAFAVFAGNLITLCVVWACVQFHRYDYRAPWVAYGAFLLPMLMLIVTILLTEGLPPHLDALAPQ